MNIQTVPVNLGEQVVLLYLTKYDPVERMIKFRSSLQPEIEQEQLIVNKQGMVVSENGQVQLRGYKVPEEFVYNFLILNGYMK